MISLPRSFFLQPTLKVAHDLLGKHIFRLLDNKLLIGTIVETEAYCHNDPASHSFRGKTERNKIMFHEGGYLYVYFTYGMHFCANIVTGKEGIGEAVLIRAVEPIAGIEVMMKNRFPKQKGIDRRSFINLTNGPAKFCQAFGIARNENGLDLLDSEIRITEGDVVPSHHIKHSSRIGIQHGKEKLWRFFIAGNPWVSR
ncbi:MAG TPA: DNA-3-methyladenine glycosylase [Bacteroidota bacterium]|nr:DNA-3-methyladenine glycosylase [Bacteroidota bacterium]